MRTTISLLTVFSLEVWDCTAFVVPGAHHPSRITAAFVGTPSLRTTTPTSVASTVESEETEDAAAEAPVEEAPAEEEAPATAEADEDEDSKRVLRVRHTAFIGNLPFGKLSRV